MRRRAAYVALGLATLPIGLAVRFMPLGLPGFVVKYGGSTLWAVMVYWVIAFFVPGSRPRSLALIAGLIAMLVELQRLIHFPALNAFRATLPGILLLGRFFSIWDIVAYWLAISAAALVDGWVVRRMAWER
jgi:hypothetical protein